MFERTHKQVLGLTLASAALVLAGLGPQPAVADTAAEIDREVRAALQKLYQTTPAAKKQAESAKAILVFPEVVKAGLVIGGTYGTGALLADGKTIGYFKNIEGS